MSFREVPKLRMVDEQWILDPFIPTDAASRWPEYEGKIGYVYAFSCQGYLKIGMSNSYKSRLKSIQQACPFDVECLAAEEVPLSGMAIAEGYLHCKFVSKRHKNEWFKLDFSEFLDEVETAKRYAYTFDRHCEEYYFKDRAKRTSPEYQSQMKSQHLGALKAARESSLRHLEQIEIDMQRYHSGSALGVVVA